LGEFINLTVCTL